MFRKDFRANKAYFNQEISIFIIFILKETINLLYNNDFSEMHFPTSVLKLYWKQTIKLYSIDILKDMKLASTFCNHLGWNVMLV